MPFAKGNQLAKGRTTGEMSVTAFEKRSLINYLKEQGAERFLAILERAEDKVFLDKYLQLIEFAFPKQARVIHSGDKENPLFPPLAEDQKKELGKQRIK